MKTPSKRIKAALHLVLGLTLAMLATGCVVSMSGSTHDETFERTLPLGPGGEVSIDNVNGSVEVATWDRSEVRIEAIKKVRAGTDERAREILAGTVIEVDASTDRIAIATKAKRRNDGFASWIFGGGSSANVHYTITVPARANVSAETINGAVVIRDLVGKVAAETVNGAIDVSNVVGTVDAETVNGGIDVALAGLSGRSPMKLSTVNGGITLALPANAQASLDASVTNGGIDCDLPLTHEEKGRRHLRGDLGGGGLAIELDTTNGGIDILAR